MSKALRSVSGKAEAVYERTLRILLVFLSLQQTVTLCKCSVYFTFTFQTMSLCCLVPKLPTSSLMSTFIFSSVVLFILLHSTNVLADIRVLYLTIKWYYILETYV
jgi:hypothetical protein